MINRVFDGLGIVGDMTIHETGCRLIFGPVDDVELAWIEVAALIQMDKGYEMELI